MNKKIGMILLLFLTMIAGCLDESTSSGQNDFNQQQTLEDESKKVVLRWINEVDKDNFEELFDELWTRDCKHYLNSNPEPSEYEEFKQMINRLYHEFPVITHEVHEIFAKENRVTAVFSARAIHDRNSFGVPATGKSLKWNAIAVFELFEGKIKTRWEVSDLLGLYQQLGMELKTVQK